MMRLFRGLAMLPTVLLLWSLSAAPVHAQSAETKGAETKGAQTKGAETTGAEYTGADSKAYVVGPEDVLDVQVWDNKDMNQVVFVRPDGKTSLPIVGEIQAAGKTVQELQDYLTAVYSKKIKSPEVTVIIREIRSRPVYFVGGFGRPGAMQLMRHLSLFQAVAIVGGVAPGADGENGFVLRKDKRIPVNFTKLLQKGDLTQDLMLEPGDSVVAPIADVVYLQGEVRGPGAVKFLPDLTVVKAITQAGGLTPMAAGGRVDIIRWKGEKRERIRVDVDKMMRAPDENPDVMLKPDDIVFVPQRLF